MNIKTLSFDVLSIIADFFIDQKTTTLTIHKIMYIDSEIGKFFCQKYIVFLQKKHKVTDINDLVAKELNRSILKFPIVKKIKYHLEEMKNQKIIFENLGAKERHIIYLYAIYYNYIWFDKVTDIRWCRSKPVNLGTKDFCPYDLLEVYKRHNPTWDQSSNEFDYRCLKRIKMYTPQLFRREGNKCYRINVGEEHLFNIKYDCGGIVKTYKTIKLIKI